jgi:glutamate-ammonia-ligase adenylyltransferase
LNLAGYFDPQRAAEIASSIEGHGRAGIAEAVVDACASAADPDRALAGLDRWIRSGGDIAARIQLIADSRPYLHRLATVLGASQTIGDALLQNSELSSVLGEPKELARRVTVEDVIEEARALCADATSHSHELDRLRYLKQKTLLRIAWNDLSGDWTQPTVWMAISDLAQGLLTHAFRLCAAHAQFDPDHVAVIAMGKLGSRELNYSSDIDLVFVASEAADATDAAKFCEAFSRAVSGKMGRGDLYRVDLRLRPFGKSGPIAPSLPAALSYYANYAEPWEVQAMVRARAICGSADVGDSFVARVSALVFRGPRSDVFLESLVSMKQRYERDLLASGEDESDMKHGRGGIRDVEFLCQLAQLLTGEAHPQVRKLGTLPALKMLADIGTISAADAGLLKRAYELFRQVEHRLQIVHSQQTHRLPTDTVDRIVLARLCSSPDWEHLSSEIRRQRANVRAVLESHVPALRAASPTHAGLSEILGLDPRVAETSTLKRLADSLPDGRDIAEIAASDTGLASRLRMLAERAPRVTSEIAFHRSLWDVAYSEEIEMTEEDEEDFVAAALSDAAQPGANWEAIAASVAKRLSITAQLKEAYHGDTARTFRYLTRGVERIILYMVDHVGGGDIDVIALGRLGSRELLLGSDWDIVFVVENSSDQLRAEKQIEDLLRVARRVTIASSYLPFDLRLRPEGRDGLVVRSADGFVDYAETSMEPWERIAFTRARSLRGRESTSRLLQSITYEDPWTAEDEVIAAAARKRTQTEKLNPAESARYLKVGKGYLFDIEWLVGVMKLRLGGQAPAEPSILGAIASLKEGSRFTLIEAEALPAAYLFFSRLRNAMFLLDYDSDCMLPENPAKLDRIASFVGESSGNALLESTNEHRSAVTAMLESLVEAAR